MRKEWKAPKTPKKGYFTRIFVMLARYFSVIDTSLTTNQSLHTWSVFESSVIKVLRKMPNMVKKLRKIGKSYLKKRQRMLQEIGKVWKISKKTKCKHVIEN